MMKFTQAGFSAMTNYKKPKFFKVSIKKIPVIVFLFLIFLMMPYNVEAQSAGSSTAFNMTGFPQWAKDLRRAEIIAFGSFPFTFFLVNTMVDVIRSGMNNWDSRYAPWPFKPAGAIDMTPNQQIMTISITVGGSVIIALADYIIVRVKRNKQQREILSQPSGTPIIVRRPSGSDDI